MNKSDKFGLGVVIIIVTGIVAFWVAIGYVLVHFISKWW